MLTLLFFSKVIILQAAGVWSQNFHYIGNKVNGNYFLNDNPSYFKFHHIKNKQAPKVFPYSDKGLIKLDVPVSDVEFSILEDLQRQTKNFSPEFDHKPVDEIESMEWAAMANNRNPITDEQVKRNTRFKETYEQEPKKPTATVSKPLFSLTHEKNSKPDTSKYDHLLNFDAYLKHRPQKEKNTAESKRNNRLSSKLFNKSSKKMQHEQSDPFFSEESNLILNSQRPSHSMEWEETLEHNHKVPVDKETPHSKNLYQDIYSKNTFPYQFEFGHVFETPNGWEERYEDLDLKKNRNRGKVIWHEKNGGFGQQYWDLA